MSSQRNVSCTSHSLLLHCRFSASKADFVVGNLHLQASPGASQVMRQKQLESAAKAAAKLGSRIVLVGDFNDSNLALPGFFEDAGPPTWSDGGSSCRVDHVLVSEGLQAHVSVMWNGKGAIPNDDIPSDHAPVLAVIQ